RRKDIFSRMHSDLARGATQRKRFCNLERPSFSLFRLHNYPITKLQNYGNRLHFHSRWMLGFIGRDLRFMLQRQADIVQPVQQTMTREFVHRERRRKSSSVFHSQGFEIDRQPVVFDLLRTTCDFRHLLLVEPHRQQAVLQAVVGKDVGKGRCDHHPEAKIRQRPDRVFARGPAAEVFPRDQNRRLRIARRVQHKIAGLFLARFSVSRKAPVVEEEFAEPRALDALQELLGDDLIGVHVHLIKWDNDAGVFAKRLHSLWFTSCGSGASPRLDEAKPVPPWCYRNRQFRMSVKCPAIAAAAAIMGLTRCVRPPRPCRPSKFRLLVDAQRSPGCRMSGFMPRHIEHPDSRHSNPASRKMRCSPSSSAACLIACEPGTTMARTFGFTCCPFATRAAARRSSMRELVHDPMNTPSTAMLSIGVPGARPMYASASSAARRSASCTKLLSSGMRAFTATTIPGFVPQVTHGARDAASISITRSNCAPGSLASVRQYATASAQSFSFGAKRRPPTYAKVVSSGAICPARAPASMLILHSVMRPSIDNARTASPAYSITCPVAPSVPMRPIIPSARSFANTPSASFPLTWICIVFGFFCGRHCVASTCSTSDVPMPNA